VRIRGDLFACALGVAGLSCNLVVGVGDYSVASGADAESPAEEAGPTGQVCGASIPRTDPGFKQLVTACALAVSCDPELFPASVSDCISNDYLQAFASLACLATITTCDGFYTCQGIRVASAAECPALPTDTGVCAGQVATFCSPDVLGSVTNCSKVGGTCSTYSENTLGDRAAGCMVVPTCTDTDSNNHCSGNKLYVCNGGVGYGLDCANIDATCGTVAGDTECFFNAPACGTPSVQCDGNILSECAAATPTNQLIQYNCGLSGLTCDATGTGACVDPACAASSCTEQCSADAKTMIACVGGTSVEIDCTQLGTAGTFSSCDSDPTTGNVFCD
jgi:hypothetical protein